MEKFGDPRTGRDRSSGLADRGRSSVAHIVNRLRSMSTGLALLGVVALLAAMAGIVGSMATTVTGAAASTTSPQPPTSVQAAQSGQAPDIRVTWTPSKMSPVATGAIVQVYQVANKQGSSPKFLGQLSCQAGCTSLIFRELTIGTYYEFLVWPTTTTGTGSPLGSSAVTPASTCMVGACVTLNTASLIGPATTADSGILDSVYPVGKVGADLAALHTSMYRGSPSYNSDGTLNWTSWNVAVAAGSPTTLVLADLWTNYNGGQPPTPWSNWSGYTSWVTSTVSTILKSGEKVNYWEVYNEPGGNNNYYSSTNYATVTPSLLLQQFLVTYNAIKAASPTAAVIGPSLAQWEDYPGQYATGTTVDRTPDMVTFLNFAAANNIKLAAISWHEIVDNLGPNPTENTLLPVNLVDHVAEARALIAARPALGSPQIFVNEFGMGEVQLIPGWDVAYLSALSQSGVNSAGRSCWGGACANPMLDGLLGTDGSSPWNDYFVRQLYAGMSGSMISATSSSDFVTALGSYNSATSTVSGLVGRAVGCNQEAWCTQTWPNDSLAPPTAVSITVNVPWTSGSATVAMTYVSGQTLGAVTTAPSAVRTTATITPNGKGAGIVTISIPSFADGDAYGFTITH
ncbi:MAG TPA: glycoside hydrolase family 44 protein [Acidimicrobiales bacterium]|nr:glycoside hydrolase family 44 protein [Acidimicrobiales bacterium]